MSEKQDKSNELERIQTTNASLEKPQNIKRPVVGNIKYANIIFINVLVLSMFIWVGWHFFGKQYMAAIEERLALVDRTKVNNHSLSESGIQKLQEAITLIHKNIEDINLKNNTLSRVAEIVKELEENIQKLKLRIDSFEAKESKTRMDVSRQNSWQEKIRQAIKSGIFLKELQQDDKIPTDVRQLLAQLEKPVTYKEISEDWNKIRDLVRFKGSSASSLPASKELGSWLANIKVFFKSIFRVQRLDKNNLTYEENFLRYIDKMLIEKDADGLLQSLALYEANLDQNSKEALLPWIAKIEKFRQGEIILEAVKKY
ncbi:MAG: hypothetical protein H6492_02635 [Candidatus Paracaedibacteraceae bacterium]|nr:hypothetical protein [Candidatus Paracaedibacteraceae bacterium]